MRYFQKKILGPADFAGLFDEKDVDWFVDELMNVTEGLSNDGIFLKAEQYLFEACIGFLRFETPSEDCNLEILKEMLSAISSNSYVEYDTIKETNAIDVMFTEIGEKNGYSPLADFADISFKDWAYVPFYADKYKKYKLISVNIGCVTIAISCHERLNQISDEVKEEVVFDDFFNKISIKQENKISEPCDSNMSVTELLVEGNKEQN